MRTGLFVFLLVWGVHLTHAQPVESGSFAFLGVEPSARGAALGGTLSAGFQNDVNGLFYNPAFLNKTHHRRLGLSYLNHVSDVSMGFVAAGYHREGIGTFGVGLRALSWGTLERTSTDDSQDDLGTFGASDLALSLAFSRSLDKRLRAGVAVQTLLSSLDGQHATAASLDAGLVYDRPEQLLTLSASVHHLGVTFSSLGPTDDALPLDLRVGVSKQLRYLPLRLSLLGFDLTNPGASTDDASALGDVLHHVAVGGELLFSDAFQVRLSYNHRRHEQLKTSSRLDLAGFGLGFGLQISRLTIDYAFNSWSSLGGLHQFSVQTGI